MVDYVDLIDVDEDPVVLSDDKGQRDRRQRPSRGGRVLGQAGAVVGALLERRVEVVQRIGRGRAAVVQDDVDVEPALLVDENRTAVVGSAEVGGVVVERRPAERAGDAALGAGVVGGECPVCKKRKTADPMLLRRN